MDSDHSINENYNETPLFLCDPDEENDTTTNEITEAAASLHVDVQPAVETIHDADDDVEMSLGPDVKVGGENLSYLKEGSKAYSLGSRTNPPSSERASSPPQSSPQPEPAPKKKRQRANTTRPILKQWYLGSFLVSNAWSTAKGTGYIKPGEPILIERDKLQNNLSERNKATSDKKQKGKQLTLNSMFKAQSKPKQLPNTSKKPTTNSVVRLTNARGFEFGRLPQDVAGWVSKLLDQNIITFKNCTMVDCPEKLHSGADLLISLSVYILPEAFKPVKPSHESNSSNGVVWFNEGKETEEEQILRDRKSALEQLFERIGLKPRMEGSAAQDESLRKQLIQEQKTVNLEEDDEEEDVLSENELNVIYKRAQAHDTTMSEMDPCDTFTLKLRPYQKQALSWMYSRETGSASARRSHTLHPLWSEYAFPSEPDNGIIDLTADDIPFYYNPHSGELSLEFPRSADDCRGGILADVGMGKTIMLSSLIQTSRDNSDEMDVDQVDEQRPSKAKQLKLDKAFKPTQKHTTSSRSRATLIVAPASLLDQWSTELQRSSEKGSLNVIIWHGQNREDMQSIIDTDDEVIDVVITSYGTLASEHAKIERGSSPIYQIEWYRVVLDEAHNCKSRASKTAKSVFALKASRRWALTGTPIVNRLEDLYSLVKFLDFTPWSEYSFFRSFVTLPFLKRDPRAVEVVQVILESILLRREKSMKDRDGKPIVELPAKEVTIDNLQFSPLERNIYDSLYRVAKSSFDVLNAKGLVGKQYTHILAMLMRLRRAVLHPSLVLSEDEVESNAKGAEGSVDVNQLIKQFTAQEEDADEGENTAFMQNVLNTLASHSEECPICLDVMESPMLMPTCMHKCCRDCILAFLHSCGERGEEGCCPTCRTPVKESELLEVVRQKRVREASIGIPLDDRGDTPIEEHTSVVLQRNNFKSSTKLNALLQNLRRINDQDPCFRAVIFSQFTSFLDLIQAALQRENIPWFRLDGSMDMKKRRDAISGFNSPSRSPKVFLLSLKAGGVGLNLTSANHVFMMDSWWNAAIEQQAIDRVHRIGQERTVFVKHFIIEDTIEGRILQIQKRKTAIIKEAFKNQSGVSDSESLENLKIMFGEL